MTPLITLSTIGILFVLLLLLTRSVRAGRPYALRPLKGFEGLQGQIGRAIESGNQLHLTLGQASLAGQAAPTSVAAGQVLDQLARDGCANGTPPLVTVGEGTLLPLAQASLQEAFREAGRPDDFDLVHTQFVAHETDPFAYGGGVASVIQQNRVASNVMMGRLGPEIAIMSEAAERKNMSQVVGTDDPTALAVATAVSEHVLVGEELFAAGAYLDGKPSQVAGLQLQEILRWLVILGILGVTLFQII